MTEEIAVPAEALASIVANLREERDGLKRAMRTRAIIEQAKGVLIERQGISPDEAFGQLVEISQQTNVKLVEIAATLVAHRAPEPSSASASASSTVPPVVLTRAAQESGIEHVTPRTPAHQALQAHHLLLSARIASAATYDEIAESLLTDSPGWPAPNTAAILLVEADGALRLVGAAGLALEERSQWSRVPPITGLSIVAVAQTLIPEFLDNAAAILEKFPATANLPHVVEALMTVPLIVNETNLGVLRLDWRHELELTEDAQSYLKALAAPCARRCAELIDTPTDANDQARVTHIEDVDVLPLAMESLHVPAVLLSPVHERQTIVDFKIEHANSVAESLSVDNGFQLTGGTILTLFPHIGSHLLFPALRDVAQTGVACHLPRVALEQDVGSVPESSMMEIRAVRLWERLLVTWRMLTPASVFAARLRESQALIGRMIPALSRTGAEGLDVTGSCAGEQAWCDVIDVADDAVFLVVGDVRGEGAVVVAGRLCAVLRGFALTGMGVMESLDAANEYMIEFEPETFAYVLAARYVPATRQLSWATAGQGVLLCVSKDDEPRMLTGPLGLPLGAAKESAYAQAELELVKDDHVYFGTESLLTAEGRPLVDGIHWLTDVASEGNTPEDITQGSLLSVRIH